jgi:hypothetical protein
VLTTVEARDRVEAIRQIGNGDPEVAHSREDSLREDVLKMIADPGFDNIEHARTICQIALETNKVDFPRWCA